MKYHFAVLKIWTQTKDAQYFFSSIFLGKKTTLKQWKKNLEDKQAKKGKFYWWFPDFVELIWNAVCLHFDKYMYLFLTLLCFYLLLYARKKFFFLRRTDWKRHINKLAHKHTQRVRERLTHKKNVGYHHDILRSMFFHPFILCFYWKQLREREKPVQYKFNIQWFGFLCLKSETSAGGARFTLRNHYYFDPTH